MRPSAYGIQEGVSSKPQTTVIYVAKWLYSSLANLVYSIGAIIFMCSV